MSAIHNILHLDVYLALAVNHYHNFIYLILFAIIFCETGLVVTPFLPGDSLLFVAGSLAAIGSLNLYLLIILICFAAFLGDNCNFFLGRIFGENLFKNPASKIFRRDLLLKTEDFYTKHGGKTVVLARFIPLIRTFAPFVAGIGKMPYPRFIIMSLFGSISWVIIFLGGGFFFGNLPFIKAHLSILILIIVLLSVIPIIKLLFDEITAK